MKIKFIKRVMKDESYAGNLKYYEIDEVVDFESKQAQWHMASGDAVSYLESEIKHTPLPWLVDQTDQRNIRTQKRDLVAACTVANSEPEANAEFIVRACNSHYELLGLCKKAREAFNHEKLQMSALFGVNYPIYDEILGQFDVAIVKAEGK